MIRSTRPSTRIKGIHLHTLLPCRRVMPSAGAGWDAVGQTPLADHLRSVTNQRN